MNSSADCIGLIPSRLSSSRLPGKALADINGLPLVIHTAKRAKLAKKLSDVFVCTDSRQIADVCEQHEVKYLMTSKDCVNGTERIASVVEQLNTDFIIDVQGDEPLIDPLNIDKVVEHLTHSSNNDEVVLPVLRVPYNSPDSIVRVQVSTTNRVMTLTRCSLPHRYNCIPQYIYKHLSVIGFTKSSLLAYSLLRPSLNEKCESIELLRLLENDWDIRALPLTGDSFSVDLQDDLDRARLAMQNDKYFNLY